MSYSFLGGDSRENFSDQEDLFKVIEGFMGYLPNSHLSMAVNPQLNQSFAALAGTIFASQKIDQGLMQLIALASSLSSGCKYCQAHTSHGAHQAGVNEEKINDILKMNIKLNELNNKIETYNYVISDKKNENLCLNLNKNNYGDNKFKTIKKSKTKFKAVKLDHFIQNQAVLNLLLVKLMKVNVQHLVLLIMILI